MTIAEKQRVKLLSETIKKINSYKKWMVAMYIIFGFMIFIWVVTSIDDNEMYTAIPLSVLQTMMMTYCMYAFSMAFVQTNNKENASILAKSMNVNGNMSAAEMLKTLPFIAKEHALRNYCNYKKHMTALSIVMLAIVVLEFILNQAGVVTMISPMANNIAMLIFAAMNIAFLSFVFVKNMTFKAGCYTVTSVLFCVGTFGMNNFFSKLENIITEGTMPLYTWVVNIILIALPFIAAFIIEKFIIPKMPNHSWEEA